MESLMFLQKAFAALDVGIIVVDKVEPDDNDSYICIYANLASSTQAGGLRPDQFVGHRMVDAFPNLKGGGFLDLYTSVLADGEVRAQYLMPSVQAAEMLGAAEMLTGISPEAATTLVKLGVDISGLQTHRSLHRGIAAAFRRLGLTIEGAS